MGAVVAVVLAAVVVLIAVAASPQASRLTQTPLPHTFQQHAVVMTSTRVPTQAACSYSSAHHSNPLSPPPPPPPLSPLSPLLFEASGMMMTPPVIGGCSAPDMTHNRETLPN